MPLKEVLTDHQSIISLLRSIRLANARRKLLFNLSEYGVLWHEDTQKFAVEDLRVTQKKLSLVTNSTGLRHEAKIRKYFAKPEEIDIAKIDPYLQEVKEDDITSKIWSYALTFWSVPVSAGYGRRLRFIVFDRYNHKVIGIFGLCDPLIGFNLRDNFIGWNREQKHERLYNCLTAYILGSVPPYNRVLGAKLVALTTMFPEVREAFTRKYQNTKTVISGKEKMPILAMIDTFGAFEKSAIYTRLINWNFIGYTQGKSHIHITANGSWELIKEFVPENKFASYKYGQGSNWKLRTLKIGLEALGFSEDILSIGWKRAYYISPLLENWQDFLTMKDAEPIFIKSSPSMLLTYWRERWVLPRLSKLHRKLNEIP